MIMYTHTYTHMIIYTYYITYIYIYYIYIYSIHMHTYLQDFQAFPEDFRGIYPKGLNSFPHHLAVWSEVAPSGPVVAGDASFDH